MSIISKSRDCMNFPSIIRPSEGVAHLNNSWQRIRIFLQHDGAFRMSNFFSHWQTWAITYISFVWQFPELVRISRLVLCQEISLCHCHYLVGYMGKLRKSGGNLLFKPQCIFKSFHSIVRE